MMNVKREKGETSRRNDEGGGEDVEDAEETPPSMKLGGSDRRLLRSRYRELKSDVNDRKGHLAQADVVEFRGIVERAENLHKHVNKPREQITDAELLIDITSELLIVAKGAQAKNGMSAAEFVGAMIHTYGLPGAADGDPGQRLDWEALGLEACAILRHAPGLSTMVGPMDVEFKPRRAPVSRRRDRPTEKTRPEAVEEVDADRPSSETDSNMKTMFGILSKIKLVKLEHLILNRASFAQTVENLFALSFLVKDGRVEMKFSDDGSQFVVPRNAPTHAERTAGEVVNTQFVFRLDFSCWELMQQVVAEGAEVMPHRGNVVKVAPSSRTPIRKTSRNRARETPAVATPSDGMEDGSEEGGSRRLKRKILTGHFSG